MRRGTLEGGTRETFVSPTAELCKLLNTLLPSGLGDSITTTHIYEFPPVPDGLIGVATPTT